jgi:hypothetical protein
LAGVVSRRRMGRRSVVRRAENRDVVWVGLGVAGNVGRPCFVDRPLFNTEKE